MFHNEHGLLLYSLILKKLPTPRHVSGEKHGSKGYMHPNVHCSAVYNSQDVEAT